MLVGKEWKTQKSFSVQLQQARSIQWFQEYTKMVFWSTDIKVKVHSRLQTSKSLLRYRSSICKFHWKPWSKPLHPTTASLLGVFIKAEVLVRPSGWAFLISIQCPDHINPPGLVQKPARVFFQKGHIWDIWEVPLFHTFPHYLTPQQNSPGAGGKPLFNLFLCLNSSIYQVRDILTRVCFQSFRHFVTTPLCTTYSSYIRVDTSVWPENLCLFNTV